MPSLEQKRGSLYIHDFYIGRLNARSAQLIESDPEFADLLSSAADLLRETAVALTNEIADQEYDD